MRSLSILWCVAVGWGPASILAQFDFDGIPESFAPTITFAPTPSPTKAPTASPTTSPPSLSPTNPPTLPPTLSASDAPAAAGATRKPTPTPTERPTPTDAPTPTKPPTDAGGYDKRSSYNVPLWFEFAAAIGFALLVCVPCTACFVHVCVYRKKFPDFGAMGATPWYDDRRGQTYGVILFCTIVNFIALFAALMAGDDDPEVVKDFNLAVIQASSGEIRVGLNGFVHKKPGGEGDFYAWDESLPNEETTFYDYPWLESCKRNGTATYGLLIPIILVKILAAFVVYRRAYAEHDTWRAKVAGVAVEAGCFVALLGITIEFYATCWRALPNRGKRMVFPGQPNEDKVQEVWVNVASVGICLAGLMSLVMSYLHFRTPCWNSELPEYGRD